MNDKSSHEMISLSQKLDICAPLIKGPFVYLDYPVYGNVGDHLIWMGAQAFLKRHGLVPVAQYSVKNVNGKDQRNTSKNVHAPCLPLGYLAVLANLNTASIDYKSRTSKCASGESAGGDFLLER